MGEGVTTLQQNDYKLLRQHILCSVINVTLQSNSLSERARKNFPEHYKNDAACV